MNFFFLDITAASNNFHSLMTVTALCRRNGFDSLYNFAD